MLDATAGSGASSWQHNPKPVVVVVFVDVALVSGPAVFGGALPAAPAKLYRFSTFRANTYC